MMEDYFLIMRIKRGDTDAWEVLVDKYYDKIFAYCLHRSYDEVPLISLADTDFKQSPPPPRCSWVIIFYGQTCIKFLVILLS